MTKNINPFVVTGKIPPQYFCDRIDESKQLEKALCNQMNVVLTSSRRMGKTSLVDFVFDTPAIRDNYITISIDILHTTTFREFILAFGTAVFDSVATRSEKWRKQFVTFLKSLSASFGYDANSNLPTFDIKIGDVQQPEYTLQEIFKYLESIDKRCLVVIGEFQQITYYPEKNVEALMRTHIQKLSNSNFVFSGSQRRLMEEMFFSSKRPFYQSAKSIRLEPIDKDIYMDFAVQNFKEFGKKIEKEAFSHIYDTFQGVTLYIQRILKDAFSETLKGEICDVETAKRLIDEYVDENDSRLREQLAFITETQKELLYAVHEARQASGITSMAFTKKYRLRSPSSSQSAALKLLEYDMITRKEKFYSISDPLLSLWLDRRKV
ncbi:MAG: hypothetical protein J6T63_02225 [Bacteroidales bacterium]|nr:hypothetical protein [Bacteroidales bacterium]